MTSIPAWTLPRVRPRLPVGRLALGIAINVAGVALLVSELAAPAAAMMP